MEPINTFELRPQAPGRQKPHPQGLQEEPKRVRKSIRDLSTAEQDKLVKAWRHIQDPKVEGNNSFFNIAGFHGEPFRGAGYGNPQWWGGYCHHGNILFPTWHRAYLIALENALRSAPGCEDVTLPYWDESDDESSRNGIPEIILKKNWTDGQPNPLYSYKLKSKITDRLSPIPDANYSKPKGYDTCRYPYSGLRGPHDIKAALKHNSDLENTHTSEEIKQMLNDNITTWLTKPDFVNHEGKHISAGTRDKIWHCLDAEDYTLFSNTTSAQKWNDDHFQEGAPDSSDTSKAVLPVVPVESPHNDIHLAIGGVDIPGQDVDQFAGANGDMGENDTASFDPIFYLHHCFIDHLLWKWQNDHEKTDSKNISIRAEYPGTNSVDSQGPTPGISGNTWLTLETPLYPFTIDKVAAKSTDVLDFAKLPYEYAIPQHGTGSVFTGSPRPSPHQPTPPAILRISGIDRSTVAGSFVIAASHSTDSENHGPKKRKPNNLPVKAVESVLSRWHVQGCANCQTHLNVTTHLPLFQLSPQEAKRKHENNQLGAHLRKSRGGERKDITGNVTVGYMLPE